MRPRAITPSHTQLESVLKVLQAKRIITTNYKNLSFWQTLISHLKTHSDRIKFLWLRAMTVLYFRDQKNLSILCSHFLIVCKIIKFPCHVPEKRILLFPPIYRKPKLATRLGKLRTTFLERLASISSGDLEEGLQLKLARHTLKLRRIKLPVNKTKPMIVPTKPESVASVSLEPKALASPALIVHTPPSLPTISNISIAIDGHPMTIFWKKAAPVDEFPGVYRVRMFIASPGIKVPEDWVTTDLSKELTMSN
jgi:hypothetical protein